MKMFSTLMRLVCGLALVAVALIKFRELRGGLAEGVAVQFGGIALPANAVYAVLGLGGLVGLALIGRAFLPARKRS